MAEIKFEPMFESLDVELEEKVALQEAFDDAVMKKSTELMETYVTEEVQKREETLKEEYKEKVDYLTDSLDAYLDMVTENFVEENKPVFEAKIQEDKTVAILEVFDKMVELTGVDLHKIKELAADDTTEAKLEESTSKIEELTDQLVEARREADKYLKAGLINELAEGLTILEKDKFEKLAEMVSFEKSQSYVDKLTSIKEHITSQRSDDFKQETKVELPGDAFRQPGKVDPDVALDYGKYV